MAAKTKKTVSAKIPAGFAKFDAAEYLDSPEMIAAYLNEAASEHDCGALVEALGTVARARGMSGVARKAKVSRESLYKSISPGATPRIDTVQKILGAFGMRMSIVPDAPARKKPRSARKVT